MNLANCIAFYLYKKGIITKEEDPIYSYGIEIILSTSIVIFTVISLGGILGQLYNTFVYVFFYCALRGYSGGYHANSRIKCLVSSISAYLFVIFILIWLDSSAKSNIFWSAILISNLVLFTTAPSQSVVNPRTDGELKNNRRKMLIWILIINVLSISSWYFDIFKDTYFTITCALSSCAILSLISYIQNYIIRERRKKL